MIHELWCYYPNHFGIFFTVKCFYIRVNKKKRKALLDLFTCWVVILYKESFPRSSDGKESACPAGDMGSILVKIAWRRKWQPSPVFLPGESHGQRSLVGHSPAVPQTQLSFWRRRCICKLLVMYWDWSGGKLCTQEVLEGGGAWETVFKIQWILWPMWTINVSK